MPSQPLVEQIGALVAMTGTDALDIETLAGALLDAVGSTNTETKEAWRRRAPGVLIVGTDMEISSKMQPVKSYSFRWQR